MEYAVPVVKDGALTWVTARSERRQDGDRVLKTVSVESNPFKTLIVEPWAEDAEVISSSPVATMPQPAAGHVGWHFESRANATVVLTLRSATRV